jgi:hypothetical protein
MVWMDSFLYIYRHTGLPNTIARLEWHMETESLEEQLSRAGFYYLDFSGWRVSLR